MKKISLTRMWAEHKPIVVIGALAVIALVLAVVALAQAQQTKSIVISPNRASAFSADSSSCDWGWLWGCDDSEQGNSARGSLFARTATNTSSNANNGGQMPSRGECPVGQTWHPEWLSCAPAEDPPSLCDDYNYALSHDRECPGAVNHTGLPDCPAGYEPVYGAYGYNEWACTPMGPNNTTARNAGSGGQMPSRGQCPAGQTWHPEWLSCAPAEDTSYCNTTFDPINCPDQVDRTGMPDCPAGTTPVYGRVDGAGWIWSCASSGIPIRVRNCVSLYSEGDYQAQYYTEPEYSGGGDSGESWYERFWNLIW